MRAPALVCVLALAACSGDAGDPKELTFEQLRETTYADILEEPVTLGEGRFEGEPFTSDSASRPVVTLVPDKLAKGDLDGDGIDEAIVALAHNAGGSGVFMYLAVVRDNGGKPDNVASIRIGDRVKIDALEIAGGKVIADLVEHAPNDPMCCPTRQVRREWLFRGGQLIGPEPEAAPQGGRFSGHLVWGHESRSFTSCDDGREGWVINESGDELVEVYNELTSAPYQPMFVEVRGEWTEAPSQGFGAEFEKALRVTELIRAENEGFGCRLELNDMLFIASGNEPSWRVQIRDEAVSMRSIDAPVEIEFRAPRMSGQPPHVVFEAAGPESGIRISLERRRCIDTMSGARYAWAADIDIDGRHLEGCAAEGL